MARPPEDPRITDLARYRKARAAEARRKPPKSNGQGLLGANPRALLILAIMAVVIGALWLLPFIQRLI